MGLQGFNQAAAAAILLKNPAALNCEPPVWQRNLCCMAACGVADPKAVLQHAPLLLHVDHATPDFVQRRLLLQRCFQLTATQLYEQHPGGLTQIGVTRLVQRLQFAERRGRELSLFAIVYAKQEVFLAAVGASQADWEAWAAANPPAACPLYRWAQHAAAVEAARLVVVLPPELANWQKRQHSRSSRKA